MLNSKHVESVLNVRIKVETKKRMISRPTQDRDSIYEIEANRRSGGY